MTEIEQKVTAAIERITAELERVVVMLKPEWEARRDTAKTLISLSGAILVFTITFSQSVVKADTPIGWRYAVVACWLAFICALICSLGSLWFSMTLSSLPILVTGKHKEFKAAFEEGFLTGDSERVSSLIMTGFKKAMREEMIALWLLRLGVILYGVALCVFTIIGLRQLLH